jgi:signal transduction histidine kinase
VLESAITSAPLRSPGPSRIRIWPILCLAFGALIALIALSGWLGYNRSKSTYRQVSQLYAAEYEVQESLAAVRSNIASSAVLVRDFLLGSALSTATAGDELKQLRKSTEVQLILLQHLVPNRQTAKLKSLRQQIEGYWSFLEPVLTGSSRDRSGMGYSFIHAEISPRRQAALRVLNEIEQLSREAFKERKNDFAAQHANLTLYLAGSFAVTPLIALVVACISIFRTFTLERAVELHHVKARAAEQEMRRLSQQLVHAQEEERRALSRELHDEVGQLMTAVRMSIGNIEMKINGSHPQLTTEVDLAKRCASRALRSIRDLAMGLRPTMLDDLGLEDALAWYVRQHSKIYGIPVSLHVHSKLHELTNLQRTCVYRVVQESLNNTAKHARASQAEVALRVDAGTLMLEIRDDGVGFDPGHQVDAGLGLIGMRERIAELGGHIVIDSGDNVGTRVRAQFPIVRTAA